MHILTLKMSHKVPVQSFANSSVENAPMIWDLREEDKMIQLAAVGRGGRDGRSPRTLLEEYSEST